MMKRALPLVLALGLFTPALSFAEPSKEDVSAAKGLAKEGRDLRDKGDLPGALQKFKAAYALAPTPLTGLDLAQVQEKIGLIADAREVYAEIAAMPAKPGENPKYPKVREEAQGKVTALTPRIPRLKISLRPGTGSAPVVVLDGKDVPSAVLGVERRVNPGEHVVTATRDGKEIFRQKVTLQEGQLFEVDIDVSAPAPAAPTSTVSVPTSAPGNYATPGKDTPPSRVPAVVALTVGGALVVGGVVTYILARGARDDYFAGCAAQISPTCDDAGGRTKVRLLEATSFSAWGLGAIGLAAGTILLVKSSSSTTTALRLAPTVGGLSLRLGGSF